MTPINSNRIPDPDQFEITLLGTGGGYGESLVIHLGNNIWVIVDSCKSPSTREILPLAYLKQIGVNLDDVKLIVCTHWHDDHIHGLSEIVRQCQHGQYCFARVTDKEKFLFMLNLDYKKTKRQGSLSSTTEFIQSLNYLNGRNPVFAHQDCLIFRSPTGYSEIFSLSPSNQAIQNFDQEISQLISDYGSPAKRIVVDSPNAKSVVLLLKLENHIAILGGDLEVSNSNNTGWLAILDSSTAVKIGRASYFKIPHHGSENGYHKRIWSELLEVNPNSNIAPWKGQIFLPTEKMVKLYKSLTNKLSLTSPTVVSQKPKKRDRDMTKLIARFSNNLTEIKYSEGIVRNRIRRTETDWTIDTFGTARVL